MRDEPDATYLPRAQDELDRGRDPDDVVASLVQDGLPPPRAKRIVARLLKDEPAKARLRGLVMIVAGVVLAVAGFTWAARVDDFTDAAGLEQRDRTWTGQRRVTAWGQAALIGVCGGAFGVIVAGFGAYALVAGGRKLDGKRSHDL